VFDGSLRGWARSREEWLKETTWDALTLTYEASMITKFWQCTILHG